MKSIIYRLICFAALITGSTIAGAQTTTPTTRITGTLTNEAGKPADYATVSLLKAKDSLIVKGALSNETGAYSFAGIKPGTYIIKATMVGYQKGLSAAIEVTGTAAIKVPNIQMQPASHNLNTVTITGTKPLIERQNDRLVMNVENSVLAAGNSAMEILEKAPGVSIDKDDNISLKGKQGVTVMINDKLTYLSSAQLATLLRSTDGNTIQSVEIITNPSAKYDASGNSGIINIKLKKNKQSGTNGTLSATAAMGKHFRDNTSLSLNHKEGKLNIFANLSRGDNKNQNDIWIDRNVENSGNNTYFNQVSNMVFDNHYNNYRAGADFDITPKNTIGVIASGYFNPSTNGVLSKTYIGTQPQVFDNYQTATTSTVSTYKNYAFNLNDRWQIDSTGQSLNIDVDYSKFNNNSDAQYNTYYFNIDGSNAGTTPLMLRNQSPSTIDIRTAKADYTYPFNKKTKLETGVKFSNVKTDNDLEAQISTNGTYVNDANRTNHFIYDEKVSAGYVNLSTSFKKTSVQLGVRAEHTDSRGDLINSSQVVDRSYLNFFPSVFVNHTISDKNEIGINYSRRIDRPSYEDLNPFVFYLDQYTYEQGNPFLKPQYTNSYELNYTYNHTINVSLGYSRTTDVITQVLLTDSVKKATYQTNLNLRVQNNYNFNLNSPYTITKWFTGNVNFTGFYMGFKSDADQGGAGAVAYDKGKFAYQFKTTNTFLITKTFKAEVMTNYQSSLVYGYFNIKPQYNIDGGVSKSFDNKKVNVKLSVSDIFNMRKNNVTSFTNGNLIDIHQKNETRVGRLTLTYNFGNSKIKARQHQTGADDEKNRVKSGN